MLKKLIAIDASPNLIAEDVALSLKELFTPWNWTNKNYLKQLKDYFLEHHQVQDALITQSGRAALYMLLSTILEPGDEVITQAFTCLVVPNAIVWAGGVPVFVDIDRKNYNIDPVSLEKKITSKTKVVIVQHTFGIPAPLDEIQRICKQHGLILIEDCAHALGAEYDGKLLGSYGDGAIFSFNQDKVVSGVSGGVMVAKNKEIGDKFKTLETKLQPPKISSIFKSLLHPLVWFLALPLYEFLKIGKGIIFVAWKMRILGNTLTPAEQEGKMPKEILQTMSNCQARLVLQGLKRLDNDNIRRAEIAKRYRNELNFPSIVHPKLVDNIKPIFLRYPIQVEDPQKLLCLARKNGIILGKWYNTPIFPWNEIAKKYYSLGDCPVAEEVGKKIVNLPTYPRLNDKQVDRIIKIVKEVYGNK